MIEVAYSPNVNLFAIKTASLDSLSSLPCCIESLVQNYALEYCRCEGHYAGTIFYDEDYKFLGIQQVDDDGSQKQWDIYFHNTTRQEIIVYNRNGKMLRKFALPLQLRLRTPSVYLFSSDFESPRDSQPTTVFLIDDAEDIIILNQDGIISQTISKSQKLLNLADDGYHAGFVFHKYSVFFTRSSFIIYNNFDQSLFISRLKCASNGYHGASQRFVQYHKGRLYILYPGNNYQNNHFIEILQPNLISRVDTEKKQKGFDESKISSCSVGLFQIPESDLKYAYSMNTFVISKDDIINVHDVNRGVIIKYTLTGDKLGSFRLKHPSNKVGKCTMGPHGEIFVSAAASHITHIFR